MISGGLFDKLVGLSVHTFYYMMSTQHHLGGDRTNG